MSYIDHCQQNTEKFPPWTIKMEEIRLAVIKLQKNFKELVVTDNAIKDSNEDKNKVNKN